MKNPLTAIRSSAEMAGRPQTAKDLNKLTSMITDDVARMENLLSGVKELSRINTAKSENKPGPINVTDITLKYLDYMKCQTGMMLSDSVCSQPIYTDMDENRYVQIIDNLLRNAISFSPANSTVSIELNRSNSHCVLKIEDQGYGIPEVHMGKIFNRFYSHRPANDSANHTGIGLALVKSIVDGAKGKIVVDSVENKGACFSVYLPLSEYQGEMK